MTKLTRVCGTKPDAASTAEFLGNDHADVKGDEALEAHDDQAKEEVVLDGDAIALQARK